METTYKAYTIHPNSERQPDGRWLPVAELEIFHGGSVTTKPPLRAKSHGARMTRAEADVAAVQMATTWIDANGGLNKTPPACFEHAEGSGNHLTARSADEATPRVTLTEVLG